MTKCRLYFSPYAAVARRYELAAFCCYLSVALAAVLTPVCSGDFQYLLTFGFETHQPGGLVQGLWFTAQS